MRSLVRPELLTAYWDPATMWSHTTALAPFFAVHAAYADYRTKGRAHEEPFVWEWGDPRAVEEPLQALWHMTGRWQARRVFTFKQARFDERVVKAVTRLARRLNSVGVYSLGDLAGASESRYRRVAIGLQEAVSAVSKLRATKHVEPVLGTKVLHHYFPSVVPVFDTALIRHGVMRTRAFRDFVKSDGNRWLVNDSPGDAGGPGMLELHRYFAFAVAQVAATPPSVLASVRRQFGRAFSRLAPTLDVGRDDAIVWRMDAKLAEYCFVGQAEHEGLFTRA
jgi:hypothetical protein